MEHPRGSEEAWAGRGLGRSPLSVPYTEGGSNRGLQRASYRGQAGQVRHSGGFSGLWEQRAQALGRPDVSSFQVLPRRSKTGVPEFLAPREKDIQICAWNVQKLKTPQDGGNTSLG